MNEYEVEVEVTVTYKRTVRVEAESRSQALQVGRDVVEDEWLDGEGPFMAAESGTDYRATSVTPA